MSRREPTPTKGSQPLELAEVFGQFRLKGFNAAGFPVKLLAENDGTQRSQLILHDGTVQRRARSETNGSLITSLYGKASGTLTALRTEATGELTIVNHGKDAAGNIDPVRTNDSQQLFYELFEKWLFFAPAELTTSDAIVLNPGTTSADLYLVDMEVYSLTAGPAVVTLYLDVAAGGTPSNDEYLMNAESLPANDRLTFSRLIRGNDRFRAFTAAGNDANIHFNVRQVARV